MARLVETLAFLDAIQGMNEVYFRFMLSNFGQILNLSNNSWDTFVGQNFVQSIWSGKNVEQKTFTNCLKITKAIKISAS